MKILVVDDEKDIQTLYLQRFRKEIRESLLQFEFSFSGKEALDYLDKHHSEGVLILTDINMPGISGFDLLKKVKDEFHCPAPVIIMISAYGDEESLIKARQLGADDFFIKPVDFISLKEKLINLSRA